MGEEKTRATKDAELAAIRKIMATLDGLTTEQRRRVFAYVADRETVGEES